MKTCKDCVHFNICSQFGVFDRDIGDNIEYIICRDFVAKSIDPDYNFIVWCAVNYALGRQTYAPDVVTEYIKRNIDDLTSQDIAVIVRIIKDASNYGDARIDKPIWMSLQSFLECELERRRLETE